MQQDTPRLPSRPHFARSPSDPLPRVLDTVLVVEDEGNIRSLVMGVLQGAGFTVLGALEGTDALEICAEHPKPSHLMITDSKGRICVLREVNDAGGDEFNRLKDNKGDDRDPPRLLLPWALRGSTQDHLNDGS